MKGRIEHLLDLNPDNYYIGTVWCQGEHDGGNPTGHKTAFETMTKDFFEYFNANYPDRVGKDGGVEWSKNQWFTYDTVPYWTTVGAGNAGNASGVKQIFDYYKTWSPDTYVNINFGTNSALYTNQTNGATVRAYITSSIRPSHYGNGAFAQLVAPSVIEKMEEAKTIPSIEK